MTDKNIVLVYQDKGVSKVSFNHTVKFLKKFSQKYSFTTQTVNASDLRQNKLDAKIKLIVIPGGADIPYDQKLGEIGCNNIRQYVQNGGNYLGICAGAYFAADTIEFAKDSTMEIITDRKLKFFNGIAYGPIANKFIYNSEKGSSAEEIVFQSKSIYTYYNGGCSFKSSDNSNFTCVAEYVTTHTPAIIQCQCVSGKAILSGVHFEYSSSNMQKINKSLNQSIIDSVASTDFNKNELSDFILSHLLK